MVTELADFPAIKKLAEALWRQDTKRHGAAIMIGSGFSRCSSRHADSTKKLPLWNDFAKRLASELGENNKDLAFIDPLRIAEEYRAYFGQTALNDLIKSEIHDEAWQPGALHSDLLNLPWSDVLTTNWDTLLERAARNVQSPIYGVVTKQTDLSCVRSPRIVKLHGSIGVSEQFVVTQEDYRKYPQEFAAFVNYTRQVFIENELCLLGFSGDDPNFLQWAGWVRDQLANNTRRIYLVGALNLTVSNRKFLESINIAPIDLWEAVKDFDDHDVRHQQATEKFLKALLDQKPKSQHKWEPTSFVSQQMSIEDHSRQYKDHAYAASLLDRQIETLRQDREAYPGWLVCPPELRRKIQSQINNPWPNPSNLACLEPTSRAMLLFEIAWRYDTTFRPVQTWLLTELASIADPAIPCAISKRHQLEVALLLAKTARRNENLPEFKQWTELLEKHALHLPDCRAEVAYQQALMARDHFDYPGIEAVIEKISGEEPVWKLKQASLLAELGRFDESRRLVSEAYQDFLAHSRHNSNSIRIHSRLAWAQWLFRSLSWADNNEMSEELTSTFRALRCDPWDQITRINEAASKQQEDYFKSQESIEPLFEKGHYQDHSSNTQFSSEATEAPPLLLLECLAESVGLPLRWENIGLLSSTAEQLVASEGLGNELRNYTLTIRAAHSDNSTAIKQVFARIALTQAKQDDIDTLTSRLLSAVAYRRNQSITGTRQQKSHARDALRVLIEVLARLAIRLSPEEAKKLFQLATEMGHDLTLRHHWLYEVIGHLMQYTLDSIPATQQSDLLLDALSFPLPLENKDSNVDWLWPRPIISALCERKSNPLLDARINELIDFVVPGAPSCASILERLLPLAKNETLKKVELAKLAKRIWGETPDYKILPNTGLYTFVLLILPAIDRDKANALISRHLFDTGNPLFLNSEHLSGLIGAATSTPKPLLPNSEQASKCFDSLVQQWRPETQADTLQEMISVKRKASSEVIGKALSYSITPALDANEITVERFEKLQLLNTDVGIPSAIIAFVYFIGLNEDIATFVEKAIRKGLQRHIAQDIGWSAHALYKWKELSETRKIQPPPENLLSKVIYLIESGRTVGLHGLLWWAGEMIKKNWLSSRDVDTLADCLPDLFDAADYCNIKPGSREAVTAPLIRENCVNLAKTVLKVAQYTKLESLIEKAKEDALPEVRFAV